MRADDMIDRRLLRRKLTFWRVISILIAAIGITGAAMWFYGNDLGTSASHIARVSIDGTINEDEELIQRLDKIGKSASVKALILSIDSPGGTTAGGEAIFDAIRRIAAQKPVVAQVGTLAASAGYMVATASDHIVARNTSIVGSIGVLVQYPDISGLMDKLGVKLEEIKSSPLKAEPSPFKPTSDAARAMIRSMILDSYQWFIGLVEDRRPLTRAEVVALADGSVFTGRQALEKKLVDELGGETEAVAWLVSQGVDEKLKVIEWKPRGGGVANLFLGGSLGRIMGQALGIPDTSDDLMRKIGAERLLLDGLVSLWHP